MIVPPGGVRVLVASRPVDFRKGMDGLAALAKETLAEDPFSGTILVFRAKRADRVKLLFWDGTGLLLVSKRLEQGAFKWPPITDGVMRLSAAQLAALIAYLTVVCPMRSAWWKRCWHRFWPSRLAWEVRRNAGKKPAKPWPPHARNWNSN